MKTLLIFFVIVAFGNNLFSQNQYKWYKNDKIIYTTDNSKKFLVIEKQISKNQLQSFIGANWEIIYYNDQKLLNNLFKPISNDLTSNLYCNAIIQAKQNNIELPSFDGLIYQTSYLKNINNISIGVSDVFMIKLKSDDDIAILENKAQNYNVKIIGQNSYLPLWYGLECTNDSRGFNSIDISNKLYETGLFDQYSPQLIFENTQLCVNDSLWNNQWGLYNSGQSGGISGIDINYCNSRNITTGSPNVIVAVVDDGIDQAHPDLQNVTTGFDPGSSTPSVPHVSVLYGSHGTECAGIIGATSNNNLGISGVAPNVTLMPISGLTNYPGGGAALPGYLAYGIMQAVENGADVINNSWSITDPDPLIDDAIENALNDGRDGLGTVVVFASGNNSSQNYPGNSNPRILTVGGIDRCGIRSGKLTFVPQSCDPWPTDQESQYGTHLDVVAPGTNVYTTYKHGYGNIGANYSSLSGTSAAAPHVAGLAALILSVNPCLTVLQVNNIIECSANKLDSYTFSWTSGRSNGSWSQEVGYGLIDVEKSLKEALSVFLQNKIETGSNLIPSMGIILAGKNVNPKLGVTTGNYAINSGANVLFKAQDYISLEDGFVASNGSEFIGQIEEFNGNCADWQTKNLFQLHEENQTSLVDPVVTTNVLERLEFNFSFFPNPYTNDLYVKFNLDKPENVNIVIYDIVGRKIFDQKHSGMTGDNIFSLDVEATSSILMASIIINGSNYTSKIIKQ